MNTDEILKGCTPTPTIVNELSDQDKIKKIEDCFTEILSHLGMDLLDDSLKETPKRVAKMYVEEIFKGLNDSSFPKITTIENKMGIDEMVVVKGIKVMSVCEHHLQTIYGSAQIAYIPKDKVLGLSKFNRVVDFFCRRPQVQERLTKQIADCLEKILDTNDVAVTIEAKHFCVISRGIQDVNSTTLTTDLRGRFKNDSMARNEFLLAVKK